ERLAFGHQLLRGLEIADCVTLELNTLGDPETREAWRTSLIDYFEGHGADLSEDSVARLQRNPLRVLDSKDPSDRAICANTPSVDDCLTAAAAEFFAAVTGGIDAAGVPWKRNPRLVRGLDYYRHTAFEFVTDRLGAQGTVIASGISAELFASGNPKKRYDRALKISPAMTISYNIRDGVAGRSNRVLRPGDVDMTRVQGILDALEPSTPLLGQS